MSVENQIDYIEIPVTNLPRAREFFSAMFGWKFQEWGDDYASFRDGRLNGGLTRAVAPAPATGVLLVFYTADLERDVTRVQELGATISKETFEFPGGRRFHFTDPVGNEYAMWTDKSANNDGA